MPTLTVHALALYHNQQLMLSLLLVAGVLRLTQQRQAGSRAARMGRLVRFHTMVPVALRRKACSCH